MKKAAVIVRMINGGFVEIGLTKLTQRIREEFEEAPGLRVTVSEAVRFWGLDEPTCEQVLARLFAAGFLSRGSDLRYQQSSGG